VCLPTTVAASGDPTNTLSDDLATVLEATGAEDAAIVGFSMGGGEVARYLSRHGAKRVRQAALISSVVPYMLQTPDNPEGTPQSTFDEIADGLRKDRAQFFATFIKSFYGVGLIERPVSAEVVEWTRAMAMSAGLLPTLACGQAFSSTDFRPDLPSFTIPTLIGVEWMRSAFYDGYGLGELLDKRYMLGFVFSSIFFGLVLERGVRGVVLR
jgi:non-heme chloroperoxidase